MEMQKIRNTLFGLLIIGLLVVTAQDALAQRRVARSEQRSDAKRPARTMVKKDKAVKQSGKQTVRKNRASRTNRPKATYSKKENRISHYRDSKKVRKDRTPRSVRPKETYSKHKNRRKDYRDSRRDNKSYNRDRKHTYKHRDSRRHYPAKKRWHWGKNRYYPNKKSWHRGYYRRPAWVDYYRPGYRYPRIGMHISVLPRGFISFRIGNFRFYTYRGVYYRYNPALRVYVVVNKPRIETWHTSATWDRITLVDGSTIEGIYHYTENDIVVFEVGDALLEIPMSEIKIMYLSEH
jgi:hypothetical protein